MRIATQLRRNSWLSLSLVLLAGAAQLAAQTAQAPALAVATQNLRFTHQIGATAPPPQTLRIFSAPNQVPFTATATSQFGWLIVGAGGTTGTATQDLLIQVNPAAITTPGDYQGQITITSGSTTLPVNVVLTVASTTQVRVEPSSINISIEAGGVRNIDLAVAPTSGSSAISFTASVQEMVPLTNWLIVTPSFGATGQAAARVTINGAAIPSDRNLVVGAVRFQAFTGGAAGTVTVPVTVTVGAAPQLSVTPTTVTFPYQIGYTPPSYRQVNVTSTTSTQLLYNATVTSAQNWLTLSTSPGVSGNIAIQNTTPNPFYLIPNIAAASTPNTYEAQITIQAAGATAQTITARLVVSNSPQLSVFQEPLPFNYTVGGAVPNSQTITISSTSTPLTYTVQPVYTSGGEWFRLSTTSGVTPGNIGISIDPVRLTQLAAGTYTGAIRVTSGALTLDVPVSLIISGSALLTVENLPVRFEGAQGQTVTERTIIVRATDGSNQQFTLSVDPPSATWLVLAQTGGNTGPTGAVVRLNVNPALVTAPGTYEAALVIRSTTTPEAPAYRVPVTYVVTGSAQITANPNTLTLTQVGSTPPPAQTINLTSSTAGLTYIASTQQNWIRISQPSNTIPGSFTVTFETGSFQPGTYEGAITLIPGVGGVQLINIPVRLTVTAGATLNVAPQSVTFNWTTASPNPPAQQIQLASSGAPINFTATTTSTGNWLAVSPGQGTTQAQGGQPTLLTLSVNPAGLTPGTYQGTIRIESTNASNSPQTVNVTLVVTAAAIPSNLTITHAATGIAGPVSPGLLVTIKGRNMAPSQGLTARIANNFVQTTLGEVRVTFDGVEAPLLYVGPSGDGVGDQINAIVPYGVGNRLSTRMVVEYRNQRSEPIDVVVAQTAPGIFTQNQSGSGPGAILNQDNSLNSLSNPAGPGTVIQVYATGEGAVAPAGRDGQVIQSLGDLRQPLAPVTVRINNVPAEVLYAGSAPTLVSGVFQVNVRIPANLGISAPANLPIEIQVGQNISQRGVTVAVRP